LLSTPWIRGRAQGGPTWQALPPRVPGVSGTAPRACRVRKGDRGNRPAEGPLSLADVRLVLGLYEGKRRSVRSHSCKSWCSASGRLGVTSAVERIPECPPSPRRRG